MYSLEQIGGCTYPGRGSKFLFQSGYIWFDSCLRKAIRDQDHYGRRVNSRERAPHTVAVVQAYLNITAMVVIGLLGHGPFVNSDVGGGGGL